MSLKIDFVEQASLPDANFAALCREFRISRPTGYKWLRRFKERGYDGLDEQSRRPRSAPLATAEDVVVAIVEARDKYPRWGAKKLVRILRSSLGENTPSAATVHRVLKRLGRVRKRTAKRPRNIVEKAPAVESREPNDVWTIDFKGWWRARDGRRCDPLTIRDGASRYLLALRLVAACTTECVREVMEGLFRRHGIPRAIQCDNGTPFVCVHSRAGLSSLSAWWISLGIRIVRSRPASPQDNGAHERMHADIAADLQVAPAQTVAAQQRACDRWRQTFNHVRPHDALRGKTPAEVYRSSPAKLRTVPPAYKTSWTVRRVTKAGTIKLAGETYFVSGALAGYDVALEPLGGVRYRVWFYNVDLGELEVLDVSDRALSLVA